MALSWRAKSIVEIGRVDTIADGVAGRCPIPAVLGDVLGVADHLPLVGERNIILGLQMLYRLCGLVVGPSAAHWIAAIVEDPARYRRKRVVTIICRSNVIPADFERWVIA
jgi:threonine dehydratase